MKKIFTLLLTTASFTTIKAQQPFTAGSIVVVRVGNGTTTLANTGNPIFLDEYNATGTKLQSIALPTVVTGANKPLVLSGTAGSEGTLTRSADGRFLALAGYSTTIPYASSLSATTGSVVPRGIAIVKNDGTVTTDRSFTNFASANNPRSAYTNNGVNVWLASGARGIQFSNGSLGDSALLICNKTSVGTAISNFRVVNEFNGQLFASTGSGSAVRIGAVGTGLPTDTGKIITTVPGLPIATPSSPYSFFAASVPSGLPASNVVYVADDNTNKVGGIKKYALNVLTGNYDSVGVIDAGIIYRGLTGFVNGSTVTLYAVKNTDSLVSITDNAAFNAAPSSNTFTTLIVKAPTGTAFRGVALSPTAAPLATANFSLSASLQNNNGLITWNIENNNDIKNFIIEKSQNGRDFTDVKEITVAGVTNYSFTDNNFNGKTSYYRIKANKQNGLHIYSNTVVLSTNIKTGALQVYPNPIQDFVVVNHPKAGDKSTLSIVNILGVQVISNQISEGATQSYISLSSLPKGTYSVVYQLGETVISKLFVK